MRWRKMLGKFAKPLLTPNTRLILCRRSHPNPPGNFLIRGLNRNMESWPNAASVMKRETHSPPLTQDRLRRRLLMIDTPSTDPKIQLEHLRCAFTVNVVHRGCGVLEAAAESGLILRAQTHSTGKCGSHLIARPNPSGCDRYDRRQILAPGLW
jgi:hypothetical protein